MEQKRVPSGCFTALVTPFKEDGSIDWPGLKRNIEFQISQEITGLVPVGTTGESPTLTSGEHFKVVATTVGIGRERVFVLAGSGSNSTEEAINYTRSAQSQGCQGALLVDCYYNGPSSLELREEYYARVAKEFPDFPIVPYVIPGRTGCALLPEDLAILAARCPNVCAVKEATGDLERMRRTRELVPSDFYIISGDDDKTFEMMTDPKIGASGVISVISNIAPAAVQLMCQMISAGDTLAAERIKQALEPLFKLVTVTCERKEEAEFLVLGMEIPTLKDKFRNPLPVKTMMQGLGMPAGPCRPPLGRMTFEGVEIVRKALQRVWRQSPEILQPIEEFYSLNISERLADDSIWRALSY